MNKILLTILIGGAVAGIVYYLYDKEGAEKLMGDVKNAASDALGQITDHLTQVGKEAISGALENA